jgi:hypothetical protein
VSSIPGRVSTEQGALRVCNFIPNAATQPVAIDTRSDNAAATTSSQKSKAPPPKVIVPEENRVPTLLLLAMFAVAARYRATPEAPIPANEGFMWNAGDDYLEDAKRILSTRDDFT